MSADSGLFALAVLILYALNTTPIYLLALKRRYPNRWIAFVPIINLVVVAWIGGVPAVAVALLAVPLVGFLLWGYLWAMACRASGVPEWLGWLCVVPVAGQTLLPCAIALRGAPASLKPLPGDLL